MVYPISPIVMPTSPATNITPFTYRDGLSYLQRLERIVKYINSVVIPYVNDSYGELAEATEEQINLLIEQVNILTQQIIDSSIELQDPVLNEIIINTESSSRTTLDSLYITADQFDELENTIASIELVVSNLPSAYATKTEFNTLNDDVNSRLSNATLESKYALLTHIESINETLNGRLSTTSLNNAYANKATQSTVETGRLSDTSLIEKFAERAYRRATVQSEMRKTRNSSDGTYTYDVFRIKTHGVFIPRLVRKEFAFDYQSAGTSGSNFKPTREPILDAAIRLGATGIFSAGGWRPSGNTNEMFGAQIRNGIQYHGMSTGDNRDAESLGFKADGTVKMYSARRGDTVTKMLNEGIVDSFSYGPILVENGVKVNIGSDSYWGSWNDTVSARNILGVSQTGDIIIIQTDGISGSSGIRGNDISDLAVAEGCYNAIGMDGGGTVQGVVGGTLSHPSSDSSGIRNCPDFIVLSAPVSGTPETGFIALTPTALSGSISFKVRSGMVTVRGQLTGDVPTGTLVVATMPEVFRPAFNARGSTYFSGAYHGGAYVTSGGEVGIFQQTGATRSAPQFEVVYPL